MLIRRMTLVAVVMSLFTSACDSQTQSEGAHVHGLANLMIATDGAGTADVVFEAPAESIYGFEHVATSPEDIAARDEAMVLLEQRVDELLITPAELQCQFGDADVMVVMDDREHDNDGGEGHDDGRDDDEYDLAGEHSEVRARWHLRCEGSLDGATLRIAFGEYFTGIEALNVTVLGLTGQKAERLAGGVGSVDL